MKRSWFSRHPLCFMALYLILYLSAFNFLNTQIHMPHILVHCRLDDLMLFFATPDVLAGLVTWAGFDNDAPDAVAAPFGSGCSTVVSQAVRENRNGGRRCFLGLFDPSVRPWVGADELCFVIPMSRFAGICGTMRASCLFGTHAWDKVRERINKMNL